MYIQKHILIILILFIFICLTPINAFTVHDSDKNTVSYSQGKSIISTYIVADDILSESNMKKDLNKIGKITVKLDGKTVNTIKKGKGWTNYKYYPLAIIDKKTIVKGNIKGKKISINVYDNKNKLLTSKTDKLKTIYTKTSKKLVKSKYPKNSKLTYNQALKIAKIGQKKSIETLNYRGYYYIEGDLFWSFKLSNKKTNDFTIYSVSDMYSSIEFGGL